MALPEKTEGQLERLYGDFGRWALRTVGKLAGRVPVNLGRTAAATGARATRGAADKIAPNRAALRHMAQTGREVVEVSGDDLAKLFRAQLRRSKTPFVRERPRGDEAGQMVYRFIVPANQLGLVRTSLEDATRARDQQVSKQASKKDRAAEIRAKADTLTEAGVDKAKTRTRDAVERGDSR